MLLDIGYLLGELGEALRIYDQAYSIMEYINTSVLQPVRKAAELNDFNISFSNLRDYRSQYMPEMGESFHEEQNFLLADLEECLLKNKHVVARTTKFFNDPQSLRGPDAPGLTRVLPFQL